MESGDVQCHQQRKLVLSKIRELVEALDSSYCDELQKNKCIPQNYVKPNKETSNVNERTDEANKWTRDPYERTPPPKGDICGDYLPRETYVSPPPSPDRGNPKMTLDGRDVRSRPIYYTKEEKPMPTRPPPWVRPRSASVELRGGIHNIGCDCVRRNGLQDDCPRWDCSGRPECDHHPWPTCFPQDSAPYLGVRKPNQVRVSRLSQAQMNANFEQENACPPGQTNNADWKNQNYPERRDDSSYGNCGCCCGN